MEVYTNTRTAVVVTPLGSCLAVLVASHGQHSAAERANAGDVFQGTAGLALGRDACRLCADTRGADDDTGDLQGMNEMKASRSRGGATQGSLSVC